MTSATLEAHVVHEGVGLGESPRWRDGRLWFADWLAGRIVALDASGAVEIVAEVADLPLCFDWGRDGRLLVVSGRRGRVLARTSDGGSFDTLADLTSLMAPPWNEIVVDGRGNAYLNCTGFDFPHAPFAPGIVALLGPDGALRQVADDVAFPNGMVVTPDGRTLIVAESYAHRLTAFDIAGDGTLVNRRVWAALGDGVPDGICLDAEGAVWYADVPNRRCVRVCEGGRELACVVADRGCFACTLGGDDGRTLYVLASEWSGSLAAAASPTGRVLAASAPASAARPPRPGG